LGGEAKAWFNSLAPKSITSKESCIYSFCNKYFPASKIHALVEEIIHFAQDKEGILQAWGDLGPILLGSCLCISRLIENGGEKLVREEAPRSWGRML
jgi:hypothetical protein